MIVLALLGGLSIRLPRGLPFGRVAGTQFVSVVEEKVVLLGPRHFEEGTSFHVVFTVVVVTVASMLHGDDEDRMKAMYGHRTGCPFILTVHVIDAW